MPTDAERAAADYGSPVSQAEAVRQARVALDRLLVDPVSARVEFGEVARGYRQNGAFGDRLWCYRLPASVWARNGFGGGVGHRAWEFVYRDGRLVEVHAERLYGRHLFMRRVWRDRG